jgi:hypothetical protein
VLCIRIGEPEAAATVKVVLGADLPGRGGADTGHARRDNHAPYLLGRRRLHGDPGRQRVHLPDELGWMGADEAGAVEHGVATPEGAPQRGAVQCVSANRVELDVT